MASDPAVLGTPAIYLDDEGREYTDNLEKSYGLVTNYTESPEDQEKSIQKGIELLQNPNLKEKTMVRRNRMLEEKIDVTCFLTETIEEYLVTKL